jgi:heptosyltransferase-3
LVAVFTRAHASAGSAIPEGLPIQRILIVRPVHSLGNLLMLTSLLAELEQVFPGAEVDIAVALGVAQDLFRNFPQVKRIHQLPRHIPRSPLQYFKAVSALRRRRYDLVLNPDPNSNTGRLLCRLLRPKHLLSLMEPATGSAEERHMAKAPVIWLRRQLPGSAGNRSAAVPPLDIRLDESERRWGKAELDHISRSAEPIRTRTLALFTGGTGNKRLNPGWWEDFHGLLNERLHDFSCVEILPADGHSSLSGRLPTFYSTKIREVGAVIGAADAFIGTDSGIMHVASAVGAPTIGLFTTADPEVWSPFGASECMVLMAATDGRRSAESAVEVLLRMIR